MREPAFWHRPAGWQAELLAPLAALYGAVSEARMRRPGRTAQVPVICIGNYHLGGAGKTQVARTLARLLRQDGAEPVFLSRGHGGTLAGPVMVDPRRHRAAEVGDEPLVLAQDGTVIVARDRAAGSILAETIGPGPIVMDDGFQNPSLHKDLSILVVDAVRGIGNGRVFPAGPLRAPLPVQLERTDMLVVIGNGEGARDLIAAVTGRGIAVFHADIVPDAGGVAALHGHAVFAFAGIGDPDRFRRTLSEAGLDVRRHRWFDDHHGFTAQDMASLAAEADQEGLRLITTEKDFVRLRTDPALQSFVPRVTVCAVTLRFADERGLAEAMRSRLAASKIQRKS